MKGNMMGRWNNESTGQNSNRYSLEKRCLTWTVLESVDSCRLKGGGARFTE